LRLSIEPFPLLSSQQQNEIDVSERNLVTAKIAANQRDPNALADAIFFRRHPERHGRRIGKNETALGNEWRAILHDIEPLLTAKVASPSPAFVWPTHPLPPSETGRFVSALTKLEARVVGGNDPRTWRYLCWIEMLKNSKTDDRVIRWSRICPATTGALGAAWTVGPCDITMGMPVKQEEIEKAIRTAGDVDTNGESVGIVTYLRADIVVSAEMTALPLENLQMLHDDVQRAIGNLDKWANAPLGGSSAMPKAYVSIKDWIGTRQDDQNSVYNCM
jgi:hypothetical protein